MKKSELIKKLQELPDDEVCIFDIRKNLYHASEEPNGIGIISKFKVAYEDKNVNKPFISLSYENFDYTDDGEKI